MFPPLGCQAEEQQKAAEEQRKAAEAQRAAAEAEERRLRCERPGCLPCEWHPPFDIVFERVPL